MNFKCLLDKLKELEQSTNYDLTKLEVSIYKSSGNILISLIQDNEVVNYVKLK